MVVMALLGGSPAYGDTITLYTNNFDGGVTVAGGVTATLSGHTGTASVAGYSADGFSGNLLFNGTGGSPMGQPGGPTTLTLSNLPAHTSIDINVLRAVIDSWDGPGGPGTEPWWGDFFNVAVDGVVVFRPAFGGSGGYTANEINGASQRGFNELWDDRAFNMGPEPSLSIAHTGTSVVIDFFADGPGWQGMNADGTSDESWGLENLSIDVTPVPDSGSTLLLSSIGLVGLNARTRRRS